MGTSGETGVDIDRLTHHLRGLLPGGLAFLRRMVAINSHTLNREGVRRNADLVQEAFGPLGFTYERIPAADPAHGEHLILTREGGSAGTIWLVTHLDTVYPPELEARCHFGWEETGDRIYGPGVVDIKGGTMMIHLVLSALKDMFPAAFERVTWKIGANACEEVLPPDFSRLVIEKNCERSDNRPGSEVLAILVFEPGAVCGDEFTYVTTRMGKAEFVVSAMGRSAHGGRPHHGANAVVELADAITKLHALNDHSCGKLCNVGVVAGGTAVNVVPALSEARVEVRAGTPDSLREMIDAVLALRGPGSVVSPADGFRCQVDVHKSLETAPMPENPGTARLFGLWQNAARLAGGRAVGECRGGLSDANFFWHHRPTLDGLGAPGGNLHCAERGEGREPEYLDVPSIVPKAVINTLAILDLINKETP